MLSTLQKIEQRKSLLYSLPTENKLKRLALYSACQTPDCSCQGWKAPEAPSQADNSQTTYSSKDLCHMCSHDMQAHTKHLESLQDDSLKSLLGMMVDVDNIYMTKYHEKDTDAKRVYNFMYKILRRAILTRSKPTIEGPIGMPPFEKPTISRAVKNFIVLKFQNNSNQNHRVGGMTLSTMKGLGEKFLRCLNCWTYETPSVMAKSCSEGELASYKTNYTRWLIFCFIPKFCKSFDYYEATQTFGRTFLRTVFRKTRKQFMDQCRHKKNLTPEQGVLVFDYFPLFLSMLEREIYSDTSVIWDLDFSSVAERDSVLSSS